MSADFGVILLLAVLLTLAALLWIRHEDRNRL